MAPDDDEYVPEAQFKQVDDPGLDLKVPAAQLEHEVAPESEYEPEAQVEHVINPAFACETV